MSGTERFSKYNVDSFFLERWSPRAFSNNAVDDNDLLAILEAAHWAPSCFNEQPWRFYVARSDSKRAQFLSFLTESNQVWAKNAPILIAIVSKLTFSHNNKPNRWNGFDAGTAWGYLTMEAYKRGYITHAMGGFKKDIAARELHLTEDYQVQAIVALGKHGDPSLLSTDLQKREIISSRKTLEEVISIE
ncbi:nitroreductase family protein [Desulfuribacillus alkaliarsenatis]|uniref:Nitroreductase domain-containing protein n=1 Tax=Desulfuribacillus alkaliarsenatis TaxID=766136 RepID=A0A1E5FZ70_9FIRM|nr:nitroreductase family protein [Desulfuribacillus alkaliarsenatis]OEF95870.1 hypothetical protein BHF68_10775 [Desulfuribacillus alkaliarsenatis]